MFQIKKYWLHFQLAFLGTTSSEKFKRRGLFDSKRKITFFIIRIRIEMKPFQHWQQHQLKMKLEMNHWLWFQIGSHRNKHSTRLTNKIAFSAKKVFWHFWDALWHPKTLLKSQIIFRLLIDNIREQNGVSLLNICQHILFLLTQFYHNRMHESNLEKASTN